MGQLPELGIEMGTNDDRRVRSGSGCDQRERVRGVVIHLPLLGERAVESPEVGRAAGVAAADDRFGDGVAALTNPGFDTAHGERGGTEPDVQHVHVPTAGHEGFEPGRKGAAGEGRFEGEALWGPGGGEFVEAGEHYAPGGEGGTIGIEAGKPRGDGVGVDELGDAERVGEDGTRNGCLARTVGSADDDDGWGLGHGRVARGQWVSSFLSFAAYDGLIARLLRREPPTVGTMVYPTRHYPLGSKTSYAAIFARLSCD